MVSPGVSPASNRKPARPCPIPPPPRAPRPWKNLSPRCAASSRLRALAQRRRALSEAAQERCELCGEAIPSRHRHVLDLSAGELKCACRPCGLLFDRRGAGAGHLRLVPERRLRLAGFQLDDALWEELRISISKQTLSRELRAMNYRKLSARPRHHAKNEAAVAAFKKTSPPVWRQSRKPRPAASP